MSDKDGGPAFPSPYQERDGDTYTTYFRDGMTLRDYFAAHVASGIMADNGLAKMEKNPLKAANNIAAITFFIVAAMLAEREKK